MINSCPVGLSKPSLTIASPRGAPVVPVANFFNGLIVCFLPPKLWITPLIPLTPVLMKPIMPFIPSFAKPLMSSHISLKKSLIPVHIFVQVLETLVPKPLNLSLIQFQALEAVFLIPFHISVKKLEMLLQTLFHVF